MRIIGVQFEPREFNIVANAKRIESVLDGLQPRDGDLVVLPYLALAGRSPLYAASAFNDIRPQWHPASVNWRGHVLGSTLTRIGAMHPDLFEPYAGANDNRAMTPMQLWAKWTARAREIAILVTYPERDVPSDEPPAEAAQYCGISLYDGHGVEVFHKVTVFKTDCGDCTLLSDGVVVDGESCSHVDDMSNGLPALSMSVPTEACQCTTYHAYHAYLALPIHCRCNPYTTE
jgi:hypothetical protein